MPPRASVADALIISYFVEALDGMNFGKCCGIIFGKLAGYSSFENVITLNFVAILFSFEDQKSKKV